MRKEYVDTQHFSSNPGTADDAGERRVRHVDGRIRYRHCCGRRLRSDPVHRRDRRLGGVRAQPHHRAGAEHQGLTGSAGSSTVEAALAIAAVVVVLVLCLAGVTAVSMQVRCIDAAREAARLAARGDQRNAVATARRIAPPGAQVRLEHDGGYLVATVRARSKLLPALDIAARAVSAEEPG